MRECLYKGSCRNNDLLSETLQLFREKRDEIHGVVDELESLNRSSERAVIRYLNEFYHRISEPKSVEKRFIRRCNDTP